ncbi:MAG: hypothetical protein NZ891_03880, partial [bacterium]|nr:hypothetical protein [bacterium]MDW8163865.1 hypothetical protein [Candidatus Omnitrophota bacterium]
MRQIVKYLRNKIIERNIIFLSYILIFIGIFLLFSASKGVIIREGFFIKQILWILLASIFVRFFRNSDFRNLEKLTYLFYVIILIF